MLHRCYCEQILKTKNGFTKCLTNRSEKVVKNVNGTIHNPRFLSPPLLLRRGKCRSELKWNILLCTYVISLPKVPTRNKAICISWGQYHSII